MAFTWSLHREDVLKATENKKAIPAIDCINPPKKREKLKTSLMYKEAG